jgi:hypothetical protein
MNEDLTKITEALFSIKATNEEEPAPSDEECGFVFESDPDGYDEDEYEDSEYDQWVEDTYWLGEGSDEMNMIQSALSKLDDAANYMGDDEHRYYDSEYNSLYDALKELETLAERVKQLAEDYSTY